MASIPQAKAGAARQEFYRRMDKDNLAPLWEVLDNLVPPFPVTACQPAHWSYQRVRPYIMEGGNIISAQEAVRRVLVLENPGLRGQSAITKSLYAGLQLILPGEIAPSHRHSQSALRFVIEGSGAYTAVNGERTLMRPGDFIITPSWTWHDHGNPGNEPVIWMDGLDLQIVELFAAQFMEPNPQAEQPVTAPQGTAYNTYGHNLAPLEPVSPFGKTSPIFSYPYERSRETLDMRARSEPVDACHGWKMQFINPLTGGHAMPTIGAFIQLLPKGFRSSAYRSTDSTVYAVLEGSGRLQVGEQRFEFQPRDVLVVPSWQPARFEAATECVLFSFSDRPAQQALGLWKEMRG